MTAREPGEPVSAFLARLRRDVGRLEEHPRGQISQETAAQRAGVPREMWNRWENGQRLEPKNAEKVGLAFSLDPQTLLQDPEGDLPARVRRLEDEIARLTEGEEEAQRSHDLLLERLEGLERRLGLDPPQAKPSELASPRGPFRRGRAAR